MSGKVIISSTYALLKKLRDFFQIHYWIASLL